MREFKKQTGRSRKIVGLQLGYESRCAKPHAFDVMLGSQLGVGGYRALAERGLARLQQFFAVLNERLAEREFIATDRFSVVDITAVVAVDFARVVKVRPGDTHPHLQRWRAAMAGRASMAP